MKYKIALLTGLFIIFGTLFVATSPASAFSLFPGEPSVVGKSVDYREYIVNFYLFALPATALVAVVLIMIGGIIWITSAGDQGRIAKAKEFIINAIIGLVILSGVYVILGFINPALVILSPPTLELDEFGACYNASDGTCSLTVKDGCKAPKQFREGQNCDDSVANQLQQEQLYAEFCANPDNFEVPEPIRAQSTIQCHSPQQNDFSTTPFDDPNSSALSDFFAREACKQTIQYDLLIDLDEAFNDCSPKCKSPCSPEIIVTSTNVVCECKAPSNP